MNNNNFRKKVFKTFIYVICFIFGLLIGLSFGTIYFQGAWTFLNSNFLLSLSNLITAIALLIAALIAVFYGLKQYFIQQRVTHLRKIYFEETLLTATKNIVVGMDSSRRLLALLVEALNNIINLINQRIITFLMLFITH